MFVLNRRLGERIARKAGSYRGRFNAGCRSDGSMLLALDRPQGGLLQRWIHSRVPLGWVDAFGLGSPARRAPTEVDSSQVAAGMGRCFWPWIARKAGSYRGRFIAGCCWAGSMLLAFDRPQGGLLRRWIHRRLLLGWIDAFGFGSPARRAPTEVDSSQVAAGLDRCFWLWIARKAGSYRQYMPRIDAVGARLAGDLPVELSTRPQKPAGSNRRLWDKPQEL